MFVDVCSIGFGSGDNGLGLAKNANKDIVVVARRCLQGGMQGRRQKDVQGT